MDTTRNLKDGEVPNPAIIIGCAANGEYVPCNSCDYKDNPSGCLKFRTLNDGVVMDAGAI